MNKVLARLTALLLTCFVLKIVVIQHLACIPLHAISIVIDLKTENIPCPLLFILYFSCAIVKSELARTFENGYITLPLWCINGLYWDTFSSLRQLQARHQLQVVRRWCRKGARSSITSGTLCTSSPVNGTPNPTSSTSCGDGPTQKASKCFSATASSAPTRPSMSRPGDFLKRLVFGEVSCENSTLYVRKSKVRTKLVRFLVDIGLIIQRDRQHTYKLTIGGLRSR